MTDWKIQQSDLFGPRAPKIVLPEHLRAPARALLEVLLAEAVGKSGGENETMQAREANHEQDHH